MMYSRFFSGLLSPLIGAMNFANPPIPGQADLKNDPHLNIESDLDVVSIQALQAQPDHQGRQQSQ